MRKQGAWRDARVAAEYERRRFAGPLGRRKHRRDVELVLALLRRGAPALVLDLPCGTGRLMPELAAAGLRVVGGDVSLEMLRARRFAGTPPAGVLGVVQAVGQRLPFRDRAFDAALCMRFLFHVDAADERVVILRELARVAGGVVVGQVRFRWNLKHLSRWLRKGLGRSPRYRPSLGRGEIAAELQAAGLELVELRPVSRLFSDKVLFLTRASRRRGPS